MSLHEFHINYRMSIKLCSELNNNQIVKDDGFFTIKKYLKIHVFKLNTKHTII